MPKSSIIYIQLFWLSFVGIGAALCIAWDWLLKKLDKKSRFLPFLSQTHPFIIFLALFAIGMVSMVPFVVPAYFMEWSMRAATITYLWLVIAAIITIAVSYKRWWPWLWRRIRMIRGRTWIIAVPIVAILAADALASLWIGASISENSDTYVHLAKINLLLDGHFTLDDPFFGHNGVVESRYHVNLLLGLYALGAHIAHVSALQVWDYSFAFWRLLGWLSMFATAWVFLPKVVRWRWSYLVLAAVPFMYAYKFYTASYPNRVAGIWFVLVIIGLLRLFRKKDPTLLIVGSILVALTHPTYAIIAFGFYALISVAMLLFRKFRKAHIIPLIISSLIVLAPVALTLSYPNNMSDLTFADSPITLDTFHGLSFLNTNTSPEDALMWLFFGGSVIGYGYIIWKTKGRIRTLMAASMIIYFGLIAYNAPLLALTKESIPLWLIARFQEFNRLGVIAPIIGFLAVVYALTYKIKYKWIMVVLEIGVVVAVAYSSIPHIERYFQLHEAFSDAHNEMDDLAYLRNSVYDQNVVTDSFTAYILPSVIPVNVSHIADNHATPMAGIMQRSKCADRLRTSLQASDVKAAGITRVVIISPYRGAFGEVAPTRPFLKEIQQFRQYTVYKVLPEKLPKHVGKTVCKVDYGQ